MWPDKLVGAALGELTTGQARPIDEQVLKRYCMLLKRKLYIRIVSA